jgi:hypothetical protein
MAVHVAQTDLVLQDLPSVQAPPTWTSGPHAVTENGIVDPEAVRGALSTLSSAAESDFDG